MTSQWIVSDYTRFGRFIFLKVSPCTACNRRRAFCQTNSLYPIRLGHHPVLKAFRQLLISLSFSHCLQKVCPLIAIDSGVSFDRFCCCFHFGTSPVVGEFGANCTHYLERIIWVHGMVHGMGLSLPHLMVGIYFEIYATQKWIFSILIVCDWFAILSAVHVH